MSELPEYVRELLNKIATREGFTEYTMKTGAGSNLEDNFSGEMISVSICGKRNINEITKEDELNFLCKVGPQSAQRRKDFLTDALFTREFFVYEKLLPAFAQFQQEKGLAESDSFIAYPKCYGGIVDEEKEQYVIIMEDQRPKGFSMWPKHHPVPIDHVRLVVQQLAKFHAISLAMKDQKPEVFNEFKILNDLNTVYFRNSLSILHCAFDMAYKGLENEEYKRIMKEVKDNTFAFFDDCFNYGAFEPYGVIGHGDSWNNNLLFKYMAGTSEVSSMCFVDWQQTRYCSPVIDLIFYIFTSTDKNLRDKEYGNIIKLYHSSLSEAIRKLGSDPEKLFNFSVLEKHLNKFGKYSFLLVPLLSQVMVVEAKDVPDFDELCENGNQLELVKQFDDETQSKYNRRVNDMFTDCIKYGLYWK